MANTELTENHDFLRLFVSIITFNLINNVTVNNKMETLPVEVRLTIMEHLDLVGLRAFVKASPSSHQLYQQWREPVLRSALCVTFGVVAPEAVAAHHLSKLPAYETNLVAMANFHFTVIEFHVITFCQYADWNYRRTLVVLDSIAADADRRLPFYNTFQHVKSHWHQGPRTVMPGVSLGLETHPISSIERVRLISALYRYYLCSRSLAKQYGFLWFPSKLSKLMTRRLSIPIHERQGLYAISQYVSNSIGNILRMGLKESGRIHEDGLTSLTFDILNKELSKSHKKGLDFDDPEGPQGLFSRTNEPQVRELIHSFFECEGLVTLSALIKGSRWASFHDNQIWNNGHKLHVVGRGTEDTLAVFDVRSKYKQIAKGGPVSPGWEYLRDYWVSEKVVCGENCLRDSGTESDTESDSESSDDSSKDSEDEEEDDS
ncbi:hypothetical protein QBC43DRAFT_292181 [Cladorrhinum sp. PSN259]|nr:hypothetical protein QBC43DRAFT_292181 [Cladorrhinum sp. PSN259]